MTESKTVRLVTGNSSWWKARKYRRETADRLWAMRAAGWRLTGLSRAQRKGVDTRLFTEYRLVRGPTES